MLVKFSGQLLLVAFLCNGGRVGIFDELLGDRLRVGVRLANVTGMYVVGWYAVGSYDVGS